jgi:hypothetical protein
VIPRPRHRDRGRWIAGLDPLASTGPEDGRRRLHAVDAVGLIEGRAVCLAPVSLLDPADWAWPDDADDLWPLCWICLALTHWPHPDVAPVE